jgi:hypothetical protein
MSEKLASQNGEVFDIPIAEFTGSPALESIEQKGTLKMRRPTR